MEDAFLRAICRKVNILWFLPGDYISMKGNAGLVAYYIQRGEVSERNEHAHTRLAAIINCGARVLFWGVTGWGK